MKQIKRLKRGKISLFLAAAVLSLGILSGCGAESKVAATAPGSPAIRIPTKVAELTAIGPGVISAIVIRFVNSVIVIHPCRSTIRLCTSGIAA